MKKCPNCGAEVEPGFDLCWNCNYSFAENKVIEIKEMTPQGKEIDCLRCHVPMKYTGRYKFHEGNKTGFFGNFFEAFVNREAFELYLCPKCGKVEFFSPTRDPGQS